MPSPQTGLFLQTEFAGSGEAMPEPGEVKTVWRRRLGWEIPALQGSLYLLHEKGDLFYLDDLSYLIFNLQKQVFHFKSKLVEELEISQKDVGYLKEEQLEII